MILSIIEGNVGMRGLKVYNNPKKGKLYRTIIGVGVSAILVLSGSAFFMKQSSSNNSGVIAEDTIGYEGIGFPNTKVKNENFVIFDVGDNDSIVTLFQDAKLKYCNDKDISFGIVISSDAKDQADIYRDVDYVRTIVNKYDV